jgi:hypothetical protein
MPLHAEAVPEFRFIPPGCRRSGLLSLYAISGGSYAAERPTGQCEIDDLLSLRVEEEIGKLRKARRAGPAGLP